METIVGVHVDYANRPESGTEAAFVEDWCENRHKYEATGGLWIASAVVRPAMS